MCLERSSSACSAPGRCRANGMVHRLSSCLISQNVHVRSGGVAMVQRVLSVAAALAVAVFSALPVSAQITTGNVLGTIKDAQGGVVPGATVVLISETKGTKSAPVVTNATGDYVFPNVAADTYTVEVSMEGFKTVRRTGVAVSGGDQIGRASCRGRDGRPLVKSSEDEQE